jgi:hypothetical protein
MHIPSFSFLNLPPCSGTILHTYYDAFWHSDCPPRLEFAVVWHVGDTIYLFLVQASESCRFDSYRGLCYTTLVELEWPIVGHLPVNFGKNIYVRCGHVVDLGKLESTKHELLKLWSKFSDGNLRFEPKLLLDHAFHALIAICRSLGFCSPTFM